MRSRSILAATASAALATALLASAGPQATAAPSPNSPAKLTQAVTLGAVLSHLEALQSIADVHGDRAAGRPGYKASVDYVVRRLTAAGYSPTVQPFQFDYFEENSELIRVSPLPRTFVNEVDFLRNAFDSGSPEGTATGALTGGWGARRSGGALAAHEDAGLLARELAAVVHEEAPRARELVGLPWEHPDGELLTGEVGTGQLESLGLLGLVDVDAGGALVDATVLELLDGVLGELVVGLARRVVVGRHCCCPPFVVLTRP